MSESIEDYDVFVSYDELTGEEYAERIFNSLKRRGYKVFVAHIERKERSGEFEEYVNRIIAKCHTFILVNTLDTLDRDQVIREFKQAFPKNNPTEENFWIFRHDEINVPRTTNKFFSNTGYDLSRDNQSPFRTSTNLSHAVLSKCDKKRLQKSQIVKKPKKREKFDEEQRKDFSELSQEKVFAKEFTKRGYEVDFQREIGNLLSADLILQKNNHWIICEFKENATKVSNKIFSRLLKYKNDLEYVEKNILTELWLIAKGRFNDSVKNEAKKFQIKLIDDSNIHEVLEKELVYLSVPKSMMLYGESMKIHFRVDELKNEPIKLKIKNEKGKIIIDQTFDVKSTDWLEYDIIAKGNYWKEPGELFSIIIEYGGKSVLSTIWRSNFGATVELDQKVYTWTDKVYVTLVAPDHINNETQYVDIFTNEGKILNYQLKQTGENTGIFTGEIRLSGTKKYFGKRNQHLKDLGTTKGKGPTDGFIPCGRNDGIKVSFRLSNNEQVVGSAIVRWNIGEVQWLDATYSAKVKGKIRVVDPDMNLNPDSVDKIEVKVWSDTDVIKKSVILYETNISTGIFEGEVNFDPDKPDVPTLQVSEGDTITVEYVDYTLPDPYATADELDITGTAIIGKIPSLPKPLFAQQIKKEVIDIPKKEHLVIIPRGSSVPGCEENGECYIPSVLAIELDEEVTWENKDTAAHTITSGTPEMGPDGEFDSSFFMPGTTFSFRFTKKGKYPYFDMTHPWQTGIITVK